MPSCGGPSTKRCVRLSQRLLWGPHWVEGLSGWAFRRLGLGAPRGSVAAVELGRHPGGSRASGHLGPLAADAASGLVSEEGPRRESPYPPLSRDTWVEELEVSVPLPLPFAVLGQPHGLPGGGGCTPEKCCSSGRAAGVL